MALRKPAVDTAKAQTETVSESTAADTATTVVGQGTVTEQRSDLVKEEELSLSPEQALKDEEAAKARDLEQRNTKEEEAKKAAEDDVKEEKHSEVQPEEKAVVVATPAADKAVTVSEARGGMFKQFKEELAAEGFEDMEVTGMSFERVRLHEGTFKIGGDDAELGKEFKCQILSSRAIFVVRQSSDQDAEMFYSYDPAGQFKTDGTSAEETLAEWRADGYGVEGSPLEIKPYREVMATLKGRDDEYDEMVVSLSIPPASVDRIAGVAFTAKQKFKALPSGVITECKVGKLVGEGTKAFRPWIFKVTQTVEQFEAAQAE